LPGYIRNIKF